MAHRSLSHRIALAVTIILFAFVGSVSAQDKRDRPTQDEVLELATKIAREKAEKAYYDKQAEKDSPEMREARERLEKAKKREREWDERESYKRQVANVNCPNPDDAKRVKLISAKGFEIKGTRPMASVFVFNNSDGVTSIHSTNSRIGSLVRDLGPRCSLTLSFVMRLEDGYRLDIPLVATTAGPDGRTYTSDTFISMNQAPYSYTPLLQNYLDSRKWEISRRW